jgi:hypothetical protein
MNIVNVTLAAPSPIPQAAAELPAATISIEASTSPQAKSESVLPKPTGPRRRAQCGFIVSAEFVGFNEVTIDSTTDRRLIIDNQVASYKKPFEKSAIKARAYISILGLLGTIVVDDDPRIKFKLSDFAFCGQASNDRLYFAVVCKPDKSMICCLFRAESSNQVSPSEHRPTPLN